MTWNVNFLFNGRRYNVTASSRTEKGALSSAVVKSDVPSHSKALAIFSNMRDRTWSAREAKEPKPAAVTASRDLVELPDSNDDWVNWPARVTTLSRG